MASIVTELQSRIDQLEQQLQRRHLAGDVHDRLDALERRLRGSRFASDLHDSVDRLEQQLGQWGRARRPQPPPVAGFQGGLAVAALAGVLLGAGLALLFARQAGRETREQLHEATAELAGRANALTRELRAEGQALRAQTRDTLDAVLAEVASRREPVPAATGEAARSGAGMPPASGAPEGTDERIGDTA